MVRQIKRKTISQIIKETFTSRFFLPYALLFIATVTIPVIYLVMQHPLELRERAATIATRSMVINTDDISFQRATEQVIPQSTINIVLLIGSAVIILLIILTLTVLRRRVS